MAKRMYVDYRGWRIYITNYKHFPFEVFDTLYETFEECTKVIDEYIEECESGYSYLVELGG